MLLIYVITKNSLENKNLSDAIFRAKNDSLFEQDE